MLVKVSKDYYGAFGLFNEVTHSTVTKTSKSAPFEIDDALAAPHLKSGVLVPADAEEIVQPEAVPEDAPETIKKPEAIPEDVPETIKEPEDIPDNIPEGIPEELPDTVPEDEDDLDSKSYKDIQKIAKDKGINSFGKTKGELIEAIRESE